MGWRIGNKFTLLCDLWCLGNFSILSQRISSPIFMEIRQTPVGGVKGNTETATWEAKREFSHFICSILDVSQPIANKWYPLTDASKRSRFPAVICCWVLTDMLDTRQSIATFPLLLHVPEVLRWDLIMCWIKVKNVRLLHQSYADR